MQSHQRIILVIEIYILYSTAYDIYFEFVTKNRVLKFSKTHLKTLKQSVIKLLRECCILSPKTAERTLKF